MRLAYLLTHEQAAQISKSQSGIVCDYGFGAVIENPPQALIDSMGLIPSHMPDDITDMPVVRNGRAIFPVPPAAARIALLNAGLLDDIEVAVAAGSRETQIYWEYATMLHRDNPLVLGMFAGMGIDDARGDELFIAAGGLMP